MLNWKAFERAIEAGYEHTLRQLAQPPQSWSRAMERAAPSEEGEHRR
jgi:hypothetical protein